MLIHGQNPPSQDFSLSETSENLDNGETLEEVSVTR